MDKDPSEETLLQIAKGFASTFNCRELASSLGVPLSTVDRESHASSDPANIALKVLATWKQTHGKAAKESVLHDALIHIMRKDLADALPTGSSGASLSTPPRVEAHTAGRKRSRVYLRTLLRTFCLYYSITDDDLTDCEKMAAAI